MNVYQNFGPIVQLVDSWVTYFFKVHPYQMNTWKDAFVFSDMRRYNLIMDIAAFIEKVVADPAVSLNCSSGRLFPHWLMPFSTTSTERSLTSPGSTPAFLYPVIIYHLFNPSNCGIYYFQVSYLGIRTTRWYTSIVCAAILSQLYLLSKSCLVAILFFLLLLSSKKLSIFFVNDSTFPHSK